MINNEIKILFGVQSWAVLFVSSFIYTHSELILNIGQHFSASRSHTVECASMDVDCDDGHATHTHTHNVRRYKIPNVEKSESTIKTIDLPTVFNRPFLRSFDAIFFSFLFSLLLLLVESSRFQFFTRSPLGRINIVCNLPLNRVMSQWKIPNLYIKFRMCVVLVEVLVHTPLSSSQLRKPHAENAFGTNAAIFCYWKLKLKWPVMG